MDCPFYDLCSKSMCDNYKYLTTRPSGTPRCDAFREKSTLNDNDIFQLVDLKRELN